MLKDLAVSPKNNLTSWLHRTGWPTTFGGLLGEWRRISPLAQQTQKDRDAAVKRLAIFPGRASLRAGEAIRFDATPYDGDNLPVGGVSCTWEAYDETSKESVGMGAEGLFKAPAAGTYRVVTRGAGRTAEAVVRVAGEAGLEPPAAAPQEQLPCDTPEWNDCNRRSVDDWDNRVGNPATGASGGEGVNSGNFQISAPVLNLPGRGMDLNLTLHYNSRLWHKAGSEIIYDIDRAWPAPGWNLGFGKVVAMGTQEAMLVGADGTRHSYKSTASPGAPPYTNQYNYEAKTKDGSLISYKGNVTGGKVGIADVRYPNGVRVFAHGSFNYSDPTAYPERVSDSHGNAITIFYRSQAAPQIAKVVDTLGRVITFHYDTNNLLTAITAPGVSKVLDSSGNVVTNTEPRTLVRLHYKQLPSLATNASFTLTKRVRNNTPWVIDAIYYPGTDTGYWFGDSDSYSPYGMLTTVREQRGMSFVGAAPVPPDQGATPQGVIVAGVTVNERAYNYGENISGALPNAPVYTKLTESWQGMNTPPVVTGYEVRSEVNPLGPSAASRRTETVLPNGSRRVQWAYKYESLPETDPDKYKDGLIYMEELFAPDGVTLLRRSRAEWEKGDYESPRVAEAEVTDDLGQKLKKKFGYTPQFNQVSSEKELDYDGVTVLRETKREYQHHANYTAGIHRMLGLPSVVEVFSRDEKRASRVEYEYDGAPLGDTPGAAAYYGDSCCANTAYRGNATTVKRYADAEHLAGLVTETRRFNKTGSLISTTTDGVAYVQHTYDVSTQYAYPTAQTTGAAGDPAGQNVTSAVYDFNTGVKLSATDANGKTSQTFYFAKNLRPQEMVMPTNARTVYAYDDAQMSATQTVYTAPLPGGSLVSQSVTYNNGVGRVRRVETLSPGNLWNIVETRYDEAGQVAKESRPFRAGQTPVWGERFYDYLGRLIKRTSPDGSEMRVLHNEAGRPGAATGLPGQTTRAVDAWGREQWARFDALGRLVEVVEPNPEGDGSVLGGDGLRTTYGHDGNGNLIDVVQGEQHRRFVYDSFGRLLRQKMAEASATLDEAGNYVGPTGEWSEVFGYDMRSNLVARVDARGVKAESIYAVSAAGDLDPLNRVQRVKHTAPANSSVVPAPDIIYSYVEAGDRTRLRLVDVAGVSEEEFVYDTYGRLHEKTLTIDEVGDYPFVNEYTYDALDRVTDLTYPQQHGVAGSPRKVAHQDYDIGGSPYDLKLDGVSHASQFEYDPSGQPQSLKVGSGSGQLTETYDIDQTSGTLVGQKVSRGADTLLDLDYQYLRPGTTSGRTGQVTGVIDYGDRARDRSFAYDALGRLRRAAGGGGGSAWAQSYAYDRYGNRPRVFSRKVAQFAANLYVTVLGRQPEAEGVQSLDTSLRQSHAQGEAQFLASVREAIAGFFESTEYANRQRTKSEYVYDLYKAYLDREPDQMGWLYWTGVAEGTTPQVVRQYFAESVEFTQFVRGLYPGASVSSAGAPAGLAATVAPGGTSVSLSWGAVTGASKYRVERSSDKTWGAPSVMTSADTSLSDGGVSWGAAYLYRVCAADVSNNCVSAYSNVVLAGAHSFTDDPIITAADDPSGANVTRIKAQHLVELRKSVKAARTLAQLTTAAWTDADNQLTSVHIKADHIRELRIRLDEALAALGLPVEPYTEATLATGPNGTTVKRIHFKELRERSTLRKGASSGGGAIWTGPAAPADGWGALSVDPATNRISSAGWEYDAAGNQTRVRTASGGGWQRFEYDAANRLARVKTDGGTLLATYTYGSSSQRILSDESGVRTYFGADRGRVIAEYTRSASATSPVWSRSFVYLGDRLLSTVRAGGGGGETVQHHHPDRLGTRLVTTPATSTSFEQTTLPFGAVLEAGPIEATNRRFTSYERSELTGLDYALHRQYDSLQGRFTQLDPLGMGAVKLELPQSFNLYAYVQNDPVNKVDPDGRFVIVPFLIAFGVGAALGALGAMAGMSLNNWMNNRPVFDGYGSNNFWWTVGIAGGVGGVAGLLMPWAAGVYGLRGAMAIGTASNVVQYGLTQYATGQPVSAGGVLVSAISGAIGGLIGGAYARSVMVNGLRYYDFTRDFAPLSAELAYQKNAQRIVDAFASTGPSSLMRGLTGAVTSNVDWPAFYQRMLEPLKIGHFVHTPMSFPEIKTPSSSFSSSYGGTNTTGGSFSYAGPTSPASPSMPARGSSWMTPPGVSSFNPMTPPGVSIYDPTRPPR